MLDQNTSTINSNKTFFKKLYKLHVYAGLFVAIHFTIFALTGLPLLFKDEILGKPDSNQNLNLSSEALAENYEKILHSISTQFPTDRPLALFPDDHNPNLIQARMGIEGATQLRGSRRLSFSLITAEPAIKQTEDSKLISVRIFDALLELHREFFLGSNGKLYLGLIGLVYVFMLISGFYIYGRFMKGRNLGDIRQAGAAKFSDLHKYLGVITFGWALVVALSGVFLAFNGVLIKYFQYQSLKHLTKQYEGFQTSSTETAGLNRIIQNSLKAKPNGLVEYISFPNTEFGIPGHFLLLINDNSNSAAKISELFVLRADNAVLTEVVQLPWYLKLVLLSEPLHFGDYGGIFLKIVWALFTLMSLAVSTLGVLSFFAKRKQRKMAFQINSEKKKKSKSSPWLTPSMMMIVCISGLIASLWSQGWFRNIALVMVVIPILVMIWHWKVKRVFHV